MRRLRIFHLKINSVKSNSFFMEVYNVFLRMADLIPIFKKKSDTTNGRGDTGCRKNVK